MKSKKGQYKPVDKWVRASNTRLQSDGFDYLCPLCGGYGWVDLNRKCEYCNGRGNIPLDDSRVLTAIDKWEEAADILAVSTDDIIKLLDSLYQEKI